MKRNPIILIILAVALVIVANAAVIISQHKRIQELSDIPELTMKLRQENILLKEGFFHTYDYEDATVDYKLPVYDIKGNKVWLKDALIGKDWIAMYISAGKGSCASCVTNNMEFLRELQSRDLNIFVCVEGLDKREFTAFVRQYGIDDIAYRIYDFGFPKKELSPALFFTVDRNLSCRYFYAPSPWLPELNEVWYETIDGRVDLKK